MGERGLGCRSGVLEKSSCASFLSQTLTLPMVEEYVATATTVDPQPSFPNPSALPPFKVVVYLLFLSSKQQEHPS